MTKRSRWLSLMLAVILAFSMTMPSVVLAEGEVTPEGQEPIEMTPDCSMIFPLRRDDGTCQDLVYTAQETGLYALWCDLGDCGYTGELGGEQLLEYQMYVAGEEAAPVFCDENASDTTEARHLYYFEEGQTYTFRVSLTEEAISYELSGDIWFLLQTPENIYLNQSTEEFEVYIYYGTNSEWCKIFRFQPEADEEYRTYFDQNSIGNEAQPYQMVYWLNEENEFVELYWSEEASMNVELQGGETYYMIVSVMNSPEYGSYGSAGGTYIIKSGIGSYDISDDEYYSYRVYDTWIIDGSFRAPDFYIYGYDEEEDEYSIQLQENTEYLIDESYYIFDDVENEYVKLDAEPEEEGDYYLLVSGYGKYSGSI